ncbi:Peptidoglycan/LPS O-acetylase OafA/YrhL, contains acyltransferase and SGNH-hydrolase domains [Tenacibaculum sp. 190130A14a]|uniref:Exopolysaccharide production protein ExoZ n=1 Tax=Tenacibaculum polynesiense TaxID=3137857 RepID=A0ABM9PCU3_9FLAO
MKKVYFPNLNGLRFIAALLVIIHHIEQLKNIFNLDNFYHDLPFIPIIGKLGVILFFVLSGFLITYLLLAEEEVTGTISIKDFYIRRLLRIWPLYYLIVILSFFILPFIPFLEVGDYTSQLFDSYNLKVLLFFLFLPNLALITFPPVPFASQSWSVGVEEQFYLLWPLLMKKSKYKLRLLFGVIALYFVVKFGINVYAKLFGVTEWTTLLYGFVGGFSIDCMAIGGVLAYWLYEKNNILKWLYSKYTQYLVYLILFVLIGFGVKIPHIHYEFYGVLFGIAILNLASNKETIFNLENSILNYLGKVSYGLYMFHPLAIVIILKTLMFFNIENVVLQYVLSIGLTILISGFSYKFFESYFIKKKVKFSKVLSGDNVKK